MLFCPLRRARGRSQLGAGQDGDTARSSLHIQTHTEPFYCQNHPPPPHTNRTRLLLFKNAFIVSKQVFQYRSIVLHLHLHRTSLSVSLSGDTNGHICRLTRTAGGALLASYCCLIHTFPVFFILSWHVDRGRQNRSKVEQRIIQVAYRSSS